MSMTKKEVQDTLNAKQVELAGIFAKGYENFTSDEVDEVQRRNTELTELGAKLATFTNLESIAAVNAARVKNAEPAAKQPVYPGAQDGAAELESKSIGELFVDSAAFKSYARSTGRGEEVTFGTKTVFSTTSAGGGGTVGFAPQPIRLPGAIDYRLRQPFMDALVPTARTTQNAILYMEEQLPVSGAGWVVENDSQPRESAISYIERNVPVRKLRMSLPVTDETMADAGQVMDLINTRLLSLFALEKDRAMLSGSGTSPEITGLLNWAGIQTQAKGVDPTPDAFHKAFTKIATASFFDVDGIVMHPTDWQNIRLLRTSEGLYIFGAPQEQVKPTMWGVPVTVTTGMTAGTGLVANFGAATQQFIRQEVTMAVSTEHNDNFMRGLTTIKLELRMAMVVYRPTAICTVTGI